jgi:hypothetical protein
LPENHKTNPYLLKNLSHILLRLADIHIEQLWPLDVQKVEIALFGDALDEKSLSATWRPEKEDAFSRLDLVREDARKNVWNQDRLDDLLLGEVEPANIAPRDGRDFGGGGGGGGLG